MPAWVEEDVRPVWGDAVDMTELTTMHAGAMNRKLEDMEVQETGWVRTPLGRMRDSRRHSAMSVRGEVSLAMFESTDWSERARLTTINHD